MSIELVLRAGIPDDLSALYAIEETCFLPPLRFSRRIIDGLMQHGITQVAETGGQPVGFAIGSVRGGRLRQRLGYIDTLEVLPEHRGRGIAAALLAEMDKAFSERGISTILLHVAENNEPARRLYQRNGYLQVGRTPGFYPDGTAALVLRKDLASATL